MGGKSRTRAGEGGNLAAGCEQEKKGCKGRKTEEKKGERREKERRKKKGVRRRRRMGMKEEEEGSAGRKKGEGESTRGCGGGHWIDVIGAGCGEDKLGCRKEKREEREKRRKEKGRKRGKEAGQG